MNAQSERHSKVMDQCDSSADPCAAGLIGTAHYPALTPHPFVRILSFES